MLQWYTLDPSPGRGSSWCYGDIYFRTMSKKTKKNNKKKTEIESFPNHIISHKYYMLQTKLGLRSRLLFDVAYLFKLYLNYTEGL